MAQKTIGGISGVLGELISPAPTSTESLAHGQPLAVNRGPEPVDTLLTPALLMFAFTGAVWKTQRRNEEVLGLDAVRASIHRWRSRDGRHRRE